MLDYQSVVYLCDSILPLNIYDLKIAMTLYFEPVDNKLRKWLIPFHATWGLCWYNFKEEYEMRSSADHGKVLQKMVY